MNSPHRDYILVIPARLGSTRLDRKPLLDIAGKPMILRTLERAREAVPNDKIFIATDSREIVDVCNADGANVVMTSDSCLTGTDRIAELAKELVADTYINLQGDEPLINSENITKIIEAAHRDKNSVINGWAWIRNEADFRARTVPKVVIRQDGRLMYMSRAPIPGTKGDTFEFSRKQVCVYAFPRKALMAFADVRQKTEHESAEDIEILRFLELGWEVNMIELEMSYCAVDTFEDLERVRAVYAEKDGLAQSETSASPFRPHLP
jgi:3-deoxy-manno-octulosonate cytidylyltransferase (CMP-KDO synthetase)